LAVSGWDDQRARGDRKPDDGPEPKVGLTTLGQPRLSEGAQPYPRHLGQHAVLTLPQCMHSPDTRYSILCIHPGGRWQPRVAGGRNNPLSPRRSARSSVLRHRFSHLHFRWQPRVAGGRLFHSALRSALHAVLNAVLNSVLRHRFSHLSSVICHRFSPPFSCSYVVTRSRPYLETARSARSADPTSMACTPLILDTLNSPNQPA
jgi:hypothetical protein